MKPNNDWAKCLYIIIDSYNTGVSMATVLVKYDPTFYKFQTRLREVEGAFPEIKIGRKTLTHMSKITGKLVHFTHYVCTSPKKQLILIYKKINENGIKSS